MRDRIVAFSREFYYIWPTERPSQYAAALAYYAIFSVVPVIYIAFTLADLLAGQLAVGTLVHTQIAGLLGEGVALALRETVNNLAERTSTGTPWAAAIQYM